MKEFKQLRDILDRIKPDFSKENLFRLKQELEATARQEFPLALVERIVDLLMGQVPETKLREELSAFLPLGSSLQTFDRVVYTKLLAHIELTAFMENGVNVPLQAYHLATMFGNTAVALNYLERYQTQHPQSLRPIQEACLFPLPAPGWNQLAWQGLCRSHMQDEPFRKSGILEHMVSLQTAPKISAALNEYTQYQQKIIQAEKLQSENQKNIEISEQQQNLSDKNIDLDESGKVIAQKKAENKELITTTNKLKQRATNLENGALSIAKLTEAVVALRYPKATANPPAAHLSLKYDITNTVFEEGLALQSQGREAGRKIPFIFFSQEKPQDASKKKSKKKANEKLYVIKLHKDDPKAPLLGQITACCQWLGAEGASCVRYALVHPDSGFYVLCKGTPPSEKPAKKTSAGKSQSSSDLMQVTDAILPKEIIAQTWAWRSSDNILVLDSIEAQPNLRANYRLEMIQLFHRLAWEIAETDSSIQRVHVGTGGTTHSAIGYALASEGSLPGLAGYTGYRDSHEQRVLFDKTRPLYATFHIKPSEAIASYQRLTPAERDQYQLPQLIDILLKVATQKDFEAFVQAFHPTSLTDFAQTKAHFAQALAYGNQALAFNLLEKMFDIHADKKIELLGLAVESGHEALLRHKIADDTLLKDLSKKQGEALLLETAQKGHLSIGTFLLENRTTLMTLNADSYQQLLTAAKDHRQIAQPLIKA